MTKTSKWLAAAAIGLAATLDASAYTIISQKLQSSTEFSVGAMSGSSFDSTSSAGLASAFSSVDFYDPEGVFYSAQAVSIASTVSSDDGGFIGLDHNAYAMVDVGTPIQAAFNLNGPDVEIVILAGASDVNLRVNFWIYNFFGPPASWGWDLRIAGGPEGERSTFVTPGVLDTYVDGSFAASLTPGNTYTMTFWNNVDWSATGIGRDLYRASGVHGDFNWHVESLSPAVPEPETYALMALGLVGVAAIARRRKLIAG